MVVLLYIITVCAVAGKNSNMLSLFEQALIEPIKILPMDGAVDYHGEIMPEIEAEHYFHALLAEIDWRCDQAVIFGKHIETKRKVAWYADKPYSYTYSSVTKHAIPWTKKLLALKALVEQQTGERFNSCLLNLYHNGSEGMAWHSDGEKDLKERGAIASLSFGATRRFSFKHKQSKQLISLDLKPGSLLVMKEDTQKHWLHRLPPTKKVHEARINLTFRTINFQ
mgnify:CR=1 FL=1